MDKDEILAIMEGLSLGLVEVQAAQSTGDGDVTADCSSKNDSTRSSNPVPRILLHPHETDVMEFEDQSSLRIAHLAPRRMQNPYA